MTYKQPLHDKLVQWLDWQIEKIWNCWIKDQHLVKMDSHGTCYRCGMQIAMTQTPYTYVNGPKRYHTKAEQDAGAAPVTQPPKKTQ